MHILPVIHFNTPFPCLFIYIGNVTFHFCHSCLPLLTCLSQNTMALSLCIATLIFIVSLLIPPTIFATVQTHSPNPYHGGYHHQNEDTSASGQFESESRENINMKEKLGVEKMGSNRRSAGRRLEIAVPAGSRLPDCSHACGSCSPCRLVMVSLVCSSVTEAETCPISYRCLCNSKSYPIP